MNVPTPIQPWVICPTARATPRLRVICFPGAGAGVSTFRDWWDWPDPAIEVCCLQFPGRESRIHERPIACLPELVAAVAAKLNPWLGQPYVFLGHSLGGLIAFETARAIRSAGGVGPRHLFVAACGAPQIPWPYPKIHTWSDLEFLTEVNRRYHSIPRLVFDDPEVRQFVLPGLRADFTMVETYGYEEQPGLDCPISAFAGHDDSTLPTWMVEAWRQQTIRGFDTQTLQGDHFLLASVRRQLLPVLSEDFREQSCVALP
jgi:medium-chain acyl-[acyl-carrier-protein] hydrolase